MTGDPSSENASIGSSPHDEEPEFTNEMRLELLQHVFNSSPLAICITAVDEKSTILDANPAYLSLTGRDWEQIKGRPLFQGNEAEAQSAGRLRRLGLLRTKGFFEKEEVDLTHEFGRPIPSLISAQRFRLGSRMVDIEVIMDNSERKAFEKAILHSALTDSLTGLPNRRAFDAHLESLLALPSSSATIGLVFVDLNRFKEVNDLHGHAAGDKLLQTVARRLDARLREGDFIARLGGDEFGIIFSVSPAHDISGPRLEALAAKLANDIEIDGQRVTIGSAIGIVVARPMEDAQTLLRRADQLMYRAKASRKLFAVECEGDGGDRNGFDSM